MARAAAASSRPAAPDSRLLRVRIRRSASDQRKVAVQHLLPSIDVSPFGQKGESRPTLTDLSGFVARLSTRAGAGRRVI
ncbi:hypothetical protein EVAR_12319_1 [Eumeta japonica]|uniref:Uncharacterized protein n=1 Tax=Eumeta variegata TaxID=151549 RepID=A0A4C1TUB3_EUMVA|nr:hypothetical protein EVAR_12319_1 [Eumeta japonica]